MSKEYKNKIIFNHLLELAPELNISSRDIDIVKLAVAGKKNSEIAKIYNLSPSRIPQIFWKYVVLCQRHTGMIYFEDMPPVSKEVYDSYFPISPRNTLEDIHAKIRASFSSPDTGIH